MGYVVDLTLILQAVFQVSLQDRSEGEVTKDCVTEIIYEFHLSQKKKGIHDAIVGAQHLVAKDSMVDQIKLLIKENEGELLYSGVNPFLIVHLYCAIDDG